MKRLSPLLRRGTVARRLALMVILVSTAITVVTTAIQLFSDYKRDIAAIDRGFQELRESHLPSLIQNVWTANDAQIQTQLDGLVRLPDIEYLVVQVEGKPRWMAGERQSVRQITREFPLNFEYVNRTVEIGVLSAHASLDNVYARLWEKLLVVLLSNAVKTFFVAGFILLIFNYLVTRHLSKISEFVGDAKFMEKSEPLALDRVAGKGSVPDELDSVVSAINARQMAVAEVVTNLLKSESQFRDFVDNLPAGVVLKDLEGRYLIASKMFRQWINIDSVSACLGKTSSEIFDEETTRFGVTHEHEVIETGQASIKERTISYPDGVERVVWSTKFPLFTADGKVIAVGTVNFDMTEQKNLEAQVRKSQHMETLGQLTGGIAHDFNNILGIVMGNVQLLQRQLPDDPKLQRLAETALRGTKRGAEITKKLLGFSNVSQGGTELVDLNQFIEQLRDLVERSVTPSITIRLDYDMDLWPVRVDQGDLQDAILNLSLNARDAMPDGGKLIIETANKTFQDDIVETYSTAPAGDYVMIAVRDTGMGMKPDVKDRIFEPYFSTKADQQGTGLGLSMVYGFVERAGGIISVDSSPGAGTVFRIYLPRQNIPLGETMEITSPGDIGDNSPSGDETILVVDDEHALLEVTSKQLTDLGYKCVIARDGTEALNHLKGRDKFDLLFSDIVMPGALNGFQVALAAQELKPGLKVLLTSGFTKNEGVDDGQDSQQTTAWKNKILKKPYSRDELANAVRTSLDQENA